MGDAKPRKNVFQKVHINGEKLLVPNAQDGVPPFVMMMKFYALHIPTLVMVAQQKKFADKPSKTLMECSAQEKNTPSELKAKITEKIKIDEVDSSLPLITVLYIARSGTEKFNAQYMKTF